jgi:hypothetical protein
MTAGLTVGSSSGRAILVIVAPAAYCMILFGAGADAC